MTRQDGEANFAKYNSVSGYHEECARTAVTEFRVRCIQPLCHLSDVPEKRRMSFVARGVVTKHAR
jgi:hypothetical protein